MEAVLYTTIILATMNIHVQVTRAIPTDLTKLEPRNVTLLPRTTLEPLLPCDSKRCLLPNGARVRDLYADLFHTDEELQTRVAAYERARQDNLHAQGIDTHNVLVGDGDSCCATQVQFSRANITMKDVYQTIWTVVHFPLNTPPLYQHIPSNSCIINTNNVCTGSCIMEDIYINLLVYDPSSRYGIKFAWFPVPGYCSCKNVQVTQ